MSQNYQQPSYFTGVLQPDGKIYDHRDYANPVFIGVAKEIYEELLAKHADLTKSYNEYQQMLIELEAIEVPKTQEDMIKDQAGQITEMRHTIHSQSKELSEIRQLLSQLPQQMKSMMQVSKEYDDSDIEYEEDSDETVEEETIIIPAKLGKVKKSRRFTPAHKKNKG